MGVKKDDRLNAKDIAKIKKMWIGGFKNEVIAKRFNKSLAYIGQLAKKEMWVRSMDDVNLTTVNLLDKNDFEKNLERKKIHGFPQIKRIDNDLLKEKLKHTIDLMCDETIRQITLGAVKVKDIDIIKVMELFKISETILAPQQEHNASGKVMQSIINITSIGEDVNTDNVVKTNQDCEVV